MPVDKRDKEIHETYEKLLIDLHMLRDRFEGKMNPAGFVTMMISFATETAFLCAINKEEVLPIIHDAVYQGRESYRLKEELCNE